MAARSKTDQLIVIVGPTASGKSDTAMNIARRFGGEIICADSRTVYRGLSIGTAKPSKEDQHEIPHHLLDVVEPDEVFSAAQFQRLAKQAIEEIKGRGKLPILVGGAGLFVDSVLFDYEFAKPADPKLRAELEQETVKQLQEYCTENNIDLPTNLLNKRHLIRAVEQGGINHKRKEDLPKNTLVVGIAPDKKILQQRILERAQKIFASPVINETTSIVDKYGWTAPGLSGNIYPIIHRMLQKEITKEEAIELFEKADWQLARRQMTWFRRNRFVNWCDSADEAEQLIVSYLAKV